MCTKVIFKARIVYAMRIIFKARIVYALDFFYVIFNPIALRTAKTLWSFGRSECNKVKHVILTKLQTFCYSEECVQLKSYKSSNSHS